jgi:hypothetical protein
MATLASPGRLTRCRWPFDWLAPFFELPALTHTRALGEKHD